MDLSHAQKLHLYQRGYVVIPSVVPRIMVDRAVRTINAAMGEGMDPAQMTRYRAQSYFPDIQRSDAISDLANATPAWSLAESAIGRGKLQPRGGGQIALRFPSLQDPPREPKPHIDGMHSPTNGVPEGQIYNFTALLGVLLSDVPEPLMGNFTVWPGTHQLNEHYFKTNGPQSLMQGMPRVDLPPPMPITGRAGDVVLAHYLLSHGISPNTSPNIRYAIFFRLAHVDHGQQKWESMTDAWLQWEGMRDVIAAERQPDAALTG